MSMKTLRIDHFTRVDRDVELRKLEFQADLKKIVRHFDQNRLYPWLNKLVDLNVAFQKFMDAVSAASDALPKALIGLDWNRLELHFTRPELDAFLQQSVDLVGWAQPLVRKALDHGVAIFDFLEQQMRLESVGVVPNYNGEGYILINDEKRRLMHVFRYELSIIRHQNEKYRGLKTRWIKNWSDPDRRAAPGQLKLELLERFRDLPNPATFSCFTDLSFPFEASLFPVAKRKMMRFLALT